MERTRGAAARVLDRLLAAYNAHEPATAGALYAGDATHEDIATGRPATGATAIAEGLTRFLAALPDAHWQVHTLVGDDTDAACAYELSGSLQADLGPFAASGQEVALRGAFFVSVHDGRITSSRDYWDSGTLGRQLRPPTEARG